MRGIVREEAERGATVFFSSHILGQVESVCDRVGILREGELVAIDSIEELRSKSGEETTLEIEAENVSEAALAAVRDVAGVSEAYAEGETVVVSCDGDVKMTVLDTLESEGADVQDFTTREASLEDLFAAYTGEQR